METTPVKLPISNGGASTDSSAQIQHLQIDPKNEVVMLDNCECMTLLYESCSS